jgi:hypothetical protein
LERVAAREAGRQIKKESPELISYQEIGLEIKMLPTIPTCFGLNESAKSLEGFGGTLAIFRTAIIPYSHSDWWALTGALGIVTMHNY